jgi:phosphatidylglycerophosphate synthase
MLLVMAFFGPVFAGIYRIAEEVAKLLSEGFKLLDQVIYPELAKMVVNGEAEKIWRLVIRSAFYLLGFGLAMSAFVWVAGPYILGTMFSTDYSASAPIASILVPAAALTGLMAPLLPIFYAADRPGRAIIARGVGLLAYIVSFVVLSLWIGEMGPAWAAMVGNLTGVALVFFMAKQTLRKKVRSSREAAGLEIDRRRVSLIGDSQKRIWGMHIAKWQGRAMKKAGGFVTKDKQRDANVYLGVNYVLSAGLAAKFVAARQTALMIGGKIAGVTDVTRAQAELLIGSGPEKASGLVIATPDDLAEAYNKALRKTDPPYGIDIEISAAEPIMRRQFESSYKGITDFVTKYFWPLPAYHVTRLCARLRLTPNMVTSIGLCLCIAAFYYFWKGQWALGFLTAWLMTFLDTVDGKLARTTMTYSSWGNIYDHGIDLIHPPFWYAAWFIGLGGVFPLNNPGALLVTPLGMALTAILVGYVVDRIIEGIFIAQHGFHIHVWRPFNSFMRIYTARRNPNTFIFMIGILISLFHPPAAIWGFYAVALWTWICILINTGVVLMATLSRRPVVSWMES